MTKLTVPKPLARLVTSPKRLKIAFGGRGGAKSQSFADIFLVKAEVERAKIGCFREYQNSLDDSVYSLLTAEIGRLGASGFKTMANQIRHADGGEFRFAGLARNPDAVKSKFGYKYFWVEEGHSISESSLQLLLPTLRLNDSEIWVSMNMHSTQDPIAARYIIPHLNAIDRDGYYEDDDMIVVKTNWRDNPFFPEVLSRERLRDYANLPRALYDHIWEGHPNDHVQNCIITREMFDAAIDSSTKLNWPKHGVRVASHDPSDLGPDDKGWAYRVGSHLVECEAWPNDDVNDGCDSALLRAVNNSADCFVWDGDGMGVSLKRQVADALRGKQISWVMFRGGSNPLNPHGIYEPIEGGSAQHQRTNKEVFRNLRAQAYWALRDRFYRTWLAVEHGKYVDPSMCISISGSIEQLHKLRSELCRIPLKETGDGRIQIMNKREMLKINIPSPNMADAVAMAFHYTPAMINTNAPTPVCKNYKRAWT